MAGEFSTGTKENFSTAAFLILRSCRLFDLAWLNPIPTKKHNCH